MLTLPALRIGSRRPEVANWQRFLNESGFRDPFGKTLTEDEDFGPRTDLATKDWQKTRALLVDGVVGTASRRMAYVEGFIPFLQARNYGPTLKARTIDLVVIHDMEYPELPEGAEWCARFFAGASAPKASAHYSIDSNSIVQSVRESDVAWHAPGANHDGIGIEHAGFARQSRAEWLDPYSRAELETSARLAARICRRYGLPVRRPSVDDLKAGAARGVIGHVDATNAFSKGAGHTDPGSGFPWDTYLDMVARALALLP